MSTIMATALAPMLQMEELRGEQLRPAIAVLQRRRLTMFSFTNQAPALKILQIFPLAGRSTLIARDLSLTDWILQIKNLQVWLRVPRIQMPSMSAS